MARQNQPSPQRDQQPPDTDADQQERPSQQQEQERQEEPDLLERIVSWSSALLLLGAIGFLVWEGLSHKDPPAFDVRIERTWSAQSRYYLSLAVENTGDESVQTLGVTVRLVQGDSTVSSSSTSLSWVPARSTRRAAVIFDKDPQRYEVAIDVTGYEFP